jgi:hypothetical protein
MKKRNKKILIFNTKLGRGEALAKKRNENFNFQILKFGKTASMKRGIRKF